MTEAALFHQGPVAPGSTASTVIPPPALPAIIHYRVLGIPVSIESDVPGVLERVDESYAAFHEHAGTPPDSLRLWLRRLGPEAAYLVGDSAGYVKRWLEPHDALLDLLDRLVHGVLARLHTRGIYTIHAGALVYRDRALIIAGRSGQGKTTLTLGLLRRGLRLLSDEFAITDPVTGRLVPYPRSLHIRPGTIELIPELAFLAQAPRHQLGGGIEWALAPGELERALPGCLGAPAPLRAVLLLNGGPRPGAEPVIAPVPAALAALEVLRGTWAASFDFAGGLATISQLLAPARCARLRAGAFEPTLDRIMAWLEEDNG